MAYRLRMAQDQSSLLVNEEVGVEDADSVLRADAWNVEKPLLMWAYDLPRGAEIVGEVLDPSGYTLGTMGGRDDWFTVFVPAEIPADIWALVLRDLSGGDYSFGDAGVEAVDRIPETCSGFVFRVRYGGEDPGFDEGQIVRVRGEYEATGLVIDNKAVWSL